MSITERSINVGIYLFENADVLDFSGPFEVFTTAKRLSKHQAISEVCLIGETKEAINARGKFCVTPKYHINHHPSLDVLLIVGGEHNQELSKSNVIEWISNNSTVVPVMASVCTGAFLLAKAGVLDGLTCTTHWDDIKRFRHSFPNIPVIEDIPWVDHQHVITSAGISAGIDMSLHLVSTLITPSLAIKTAKQMSYNWHTLGDKNDVKN